MFSKQGKGLAELLLKHHLPKQTDSTAKATELLASRGDKYSNDYSQFQKLASNQDPPDPKAQPTGNNPTEYLAHTHDKRKQRELFQKSTEQKLQNVEYFKNQGNKAYSGKQYDKASYCYQKAIIHFDYTFPETPQEQSRMRDLQQKCHQNMGLCMYQLGNKQEATFHLNQTLKFGESNLKALYRLAQIYLEGDLYQECGMSIRRIEIAHPDCTQVRQLSLALQKRQSQYAEKLKRISLKMMEC